MITVTISSTDGSIPFAGRDYPGAITIASWEGHAGYACGVRVVEVNTEQVDNLVAHCERLGFEARQHNEPRELVKQADDHI